MVTEDISRDQYVWILKHTVHSLLQDHFININCNTTQDFFFQNSGPPYPE